MEMKAWDERSEARLIRFVAAGKSAKDIGKLMGRSQLSIQTKINRLHQLGLIQHRLRQSRKMAHADAWDEALTPPEFAKLAVEFPKPPPGWAWIQVDRKTWKLRRQK